MSTVLQSILSSFKKLLPGGTGSPAIPDSGESIGDSNIGPIFLLLDEEHNLQDGQILIGASAVSAISNPADVPTISATTGGSLAVGDYQVGVTYKNVYGETLSSPLTDITLTSGQTAIHIDALTLPGGVTGVNRYVSDAAGSITLRKQSSASTGAAYNITALPGGTAPTPPGSNTTASSNHVEKGTPGAGTGLSVVVRPGSFVYAYDPSGPVDQNGYPMLNFVLESMADSSFPDPATNAKRIIYGTTTLSPYFSDGSNWLPFSSGGSLSDASSTTKGVLKITRDLGGSAGSPSVVGLQGRDVANTAPSNGQVLAWNSSTSRWEPATGANSNATAIRGVNVTTTSPTSGQALVYNGTSWVPQTIVPTSGNATSVGGIVVFGTPTTDQILKYNGTNWVPADVVAVTGNANSIGGFDVGADTPADRDVLTWIDADNAWKPQAPGGGGGAIFTGVEVIDPFFTSISASTFTDISGWNSEVIDTGGYYDSGGSDPDKFIIPTGKAGTYRIYFRGSFDEVSVALTNWKGIQFSSDSSGPGQINTQFQYSGASIGNFGTSGSGARVYQVISLEVTAYLDEGNYVKLSVFSRDEDCQTNSNWVFGIQLLGA